MAVSIKADHVTIRYITGDFKDIGLKEYTVRRLKGNYHVNEFMAVKDVSFELEEGEMLGIVGANGAGKSTLLKAISGIMVPTRGSIEVNGEVAALLELGSGFDGDLTVKENAYLRGAMLGYTQAFMDETYDSIIDFAELREFEDRPFKQLSSGMKSRLAFSIASLVDPDILILDEVLSVGDGAFQEKSAKKMQEIIRGGATTILVSHSLSQIRELCTKVLWLDHGRQIAFGDTQEVCNRYERFLSGDSSALEAPEQAAVILEEHPAEVPEEVSDREDEECAQQLLIASHVNTNTESANTAVPPNTPKKLGRVSAIDGLRGILSVIIALFHFGQVYPLGNTFHRGYFAVEFFFALSGFLLADKFERAGKNISVSNVVKAKLIRLYPAYFFSILSLVLLYSFTWFQGSVVAWIQSDSSHLRSLISELLLIQSTGIGNLIYVNGPVLYVSALFLSTIFFVITWKSLSKKAFYISNAALTGLIYVLLFIYNPFMGSASFFRLTRLPVPLMRGIAGTGLGACLYWLFRIADDKQLSHRKLYSAAVVSCICLIVPLVITEPSRTNFLLFIPVGTCIVSMFCLGAQGRYPILNSKPVQYLGKISYSFFVMQSFSQNVCTIYLSRVTNNPVLQNCAYIVLNLAISSFVYWCFEVSIPLFLMDSSKKGKNKEKAVGTYSIVLKLVSALLLAFFAVSVFMAVLDVLPVSAAPASTIQLTAHDNSGNVTFRGGMIGERWISPTEMDVDAGNWVYDEKQVTYTAMNGNPLILTFPAGSNRRLVFTVGPEEGVVNVSMGGKKMSFDLHHEKLVPSGLSFEVPNQDIPPWVKPLVFVLSFLAFFGFGVRARDNSHSFGGARLLSGDLIRVICCFTVVLLHSTCGRLTDFNVTDRAWIPHLLINSFTAFAVPCFYMLSGAFMLQGIHSVREVLCRRIPKLLLPLLGWSVIYILLSGDVRPERFINMFFSEQASHLWFMYPILALYLLLPVLSKMYSVMSWKEKLYLLVLLLFVQSFLYDTSALTGLYVRQPHFAMFWPDLGLFILGGFLWEYRGKAAYSRKLLPFLFGIGFSFTALGTYFLSTRVGEVNNALISEVGSSGLIIMASSVILFLSLAEDRLQMLSIRMKALIYRTAKTTFIIYMIHPLVMSLWNHRKYAWLPLYTNDGTILQLFVSAILYFAICFVIVDAWNRVKYGS